MESSPESEKPILRALRGAILPCPPFWLMRQAGRYLPEYRAVRQKIGSFLDLCYTPELAAEVTLQPIRRFDMDAAIIFSDILVLPHAMGQAVTFREGEGPVLAPIRSVEQAAELEPDQVVEQLAPVYAALRLAATLLPAHTALIGFAGAPWTVATYMVEGGTSRDFAKVKAWAFADPAGFAVLIDRLTEATILHLSAQIEAGAEIVQIFDTWAGILPEAAFRRWVIAPTSRIVAALRKIHPKIPVIGFPRAAGLLYRAYFAETRVTALSLDGAVPLGIARKTLQSFGALQGNLDPLMLVAGGAAMVEAVAQIRQNLCDGPFIFNLGHGVLPETPVENVSLLAGLLRRAA